MSNTLTREERVAFMEKWAPFAMEHQIKYGIPASLTLSQMMHESSCGTSNLCKKSNNYFGIKINYEGTPGVDFVYAHDDKPGEKFKIYNSAEDSMQGHSRMLLYDRYQKHCSKLSVTDINGWIEGVKAGGYATDPEYSKSLHEWINAYNLTKYDTMAVQMAEQRGLTCGYKKNDKEDLKKVTYPSGMSAQSMGQNSDKNSGKKLGYIEGNWHMPLAGDMVLTGELGETRGNYGKSGTHKHQGIDMRAAVGTPLYATEDNGIVTVANDIYKSGTGKHIVIKYNRPDGKSYEITCMHLDSISVKEGDTVKAGQIIGKTGQTGGNFGPHLHFEVREGGEKPREGKIIDPKEYLAEIAVRGNLDTTLKKGNEDLLLAHKREFQLTHNENENLLADNKKKETDWMSMLANGAGGGDIFGTFLSLLITVGFDLMAKEEMYRAEKQKNNKETEISDKDMAQYKSDGVRVDDARMKASTTYDSINNEESQSQTQRQRLV